MPISKYLREKNIMDLINGLGSSSYGTTYLALCANNPATTDDDAQLGEPSGNGYVRIPVRYNIISGTQQYVNNFPTTPTYDSGTDKYSITNTRDIYFYEATGSWGTLPYFVIFDQQTGGNRLAYGSLTSAISPAANTIPVVRTGNLTITEQ